MKVFLLIVFFNLVWFAFGVYVGRAWANRCMLRLINKTFPNRDVAPPDQS